MYVFTRLSTPLLLVLALNFSVAGCVSPKAPAGPVEPAAEWLLHREQNPENLRMIAAAVPLLQTGDIVLRTGADATSHALRAMNQKNKLYSHCGIVSIEDGRPWIYHSIGGEDNPDARIRRETPERFFAPVSNEGGGACRYPLKADQKAGIIQKAQQWYREGRTFDMEFDLETDSQLYCAEFVYKAFLRSGAGKEWLSKSSLGGFCYVAVDDLYAHPAAKIICCFQYK